MLKKFTMNIKSIRILIKHLRKFLAGFVSVIIPALPNYSSYRFYKQSESLKMDLGEIDQDFSAAIKKIKNKNN